MADIGYVSISVTATTRGRHLVGQRRSPPDSGHISTGYTRFWLLSPHKGPDYYTPYPKRPGCSTIMAHHAPSESHPSSCICYRRRRTRTICLMSMRYSCTGWFRLKGRNYLPHECRSQYLIKGRVLGIILTPMTVQEGDMVSVF